jgi:hypothetical protein
MNRSPTRPAAVAFDLSGPAEDRYVNLSAMRFAMAGVFSVSAGMLAWFALLGLELAHKDTNQVLVFVVVDVGLVIAMGVCAWGWWMSRMGPTQLTVDETGLSFRGRSGRSDLLRWEKIDSGVVFLDYSGSELLAKYTTRLWEIRRWNRPPADLSKEAFDAILYHARSRGLRVTSESASNRRWGPCQVYRVTVA